MRYALIIGLLISGPATAQDREVDPAKRAYLDSIQRMEEVVSGLEDVTFTMYKTEVVNGRTVETEPTLVKFRAPMNVYMRVGDADSPGQEVLFRDGWNSGKLRVSLGGWAPTLNLHPDSRLVMRRNRHSIRFVAPQVVVERIAADARLADGRDDVHVTDMGIQQRYGEAARCFEVSLPEEEPRFYADTVEMCVAERTGLLVSMRAWEQIDDSSVLVEDYGYEGLRLNIGLTDDDFSAENPGYHFKAECLIRS